ncbi:hypothetical protein BDR07DRAFT_1421354 [Suillus spraguei]|nr:hypothetical protein BDR07DRAFT_1421354 [Suillus spraguei]
MWRFHPSLFPSSGTGCFIHRGLDYYLNRVTGRGSENEQSGWIGQLILSLSYLPGLRQKAVSNHGQLLVTMLTHVRLESLTCDLRLVLGGRLRLKRMFENTPFHSAHLEP